jgi:hypothetical protein
MPAGMVRKGVLYEKDINHRCVNRSARRADMGAGHYLGRLSMGQNQ